jgi:hypothetical protein
MLCFSIEGTLKDIQHSSLIIGMEYPLPHRDPGLKEVTWITKHRRPCPSINDLPGFLVTVPKPEPSGVQRHLKPLTIDTRAISIVLPLGDILSEIAKLRTQSAIMGNWANGDREELLIAWAELKPNRRALSEAFVNVSAPHPRLFQRNPQLPLALPSASPVGYSENATCRRVVIDVSNLRPIKFNYSQECRRVFVKCL